MAVNVIDLVHPCLTPFLYIVELVVVLDIAEIMLVRRLYAIINQLFLLFFFFFIIAEGDATEEQKPAETIEHGEKKQDSPGEGGEEKQEEAPEGGEEQKEAIGGEGDEKKSEG